MMQCNKCGTISTDTDFGPDGKCPSCGSVDIGESDVEVMQCGNCQYTASADEFEEGCPKCGSKNILDFDE